LPQSSRVGKEGEVHIQDTGLKEVLEGAVPGLVMVPLVGNREEANVPEGHLGILNLVLLKEAREVRSRDSGSLISALLDKYKIYDHFIVVIYS
jgi:hypothetical protein